MPLYFNVFGDGSYFVLTSTSQNPETTLLVLQEIINEMSRPFTIEELEAAGVDTSALTADEAGQTK